MRCRTPAADQSNRRARLPAVARRGEPERAARVRNSSATGGAAVAPRGLLCESMGMPGGAPGESIPFAGGPVACVWTYWSQSSGPRAALMARAVAAVDLVNGSSWLKPSFAFNAVLGSRVTPLESRR